MELGKLTADERRKRASGRPFALRGSVRRLGITGRDLDDGAELVYAPRLVRRGGRLLVVRYRKITG